MKERTYTVRKGREILFETRDYSLAEKKLAELKKENDKVFLWEV